MKERIWNFIKQRILGVVLIVASVIGVMVNDGDATFTLITIPLGCLCMIFGNTD